MKKEFKFSYKELSSVDELNQKQKKAVKAAKEIQSNAYAPYSHFKVGAALLLKDGQIVTGVNQENKAFPSGLCAERVALYTYGALKTHQGIEMLAITGDGEMLKKSESLSPCGACRQVMAEFTDIQGESFEIIILNKDGSVLIFDGIHQLLPFIFGKK